MTLSITTLARTTFSIPIKKSSTLSINDTRHKDTAFSVLILRVTFYIVMLSVVMLNVVMLDVAAPSPKKVL
jgi:hypothetical protein